MIADCAIDPEVFAQWRHFQSLYEDFGVSRGRLISKYPKKSWVRTVATRARELVKDGINTELQASRIEGRPRGERFKWKVKRPGGREFDPERSWCDNADSAEPPFDLIIAAGSASCGCRVGAEDLVKDEAPFLWSRQRQVRRTKEALVEAARLVISAAETIAIVDPNFRADEPRFNATILHLLAELGRCDNQPKRFEIHTNRIRKPGEIFNRGPHLSQWNTHVVPHLSSGWPLTVCYWDTLPSGGKPHARFLITDLGGLYYDHGIDEGDGETLVTLLEEDIWASLRPVFDSTKLPEDFEPDEFVLELGP